MQTDVGEKLVRVVASDFHWCGIVIDNSPMWHESRLNIEQIIIGQRHEKLHADKLKVDQLANLLKPIRKMYITTDRTGRAALEVMVLRAIRGE